MRHITEEQKAKTKERRQILRQIVKEIAKMSEDQRKAISEKMGLLVNPNGHPFSLFNTLLIASQGAQNPTILGGFKQWREHGRAVKKGEHGYAIFFPVTPKNGDQDEPKEEDIEEDTLKFYIGYVFDISQTIEIETQNN